MNKKILIFILAIYFYGLVVALPNPASVYCLEMNYTIDGENCVFSDGERCEQWKFFNGECGAEYVKNLSCKSAGERLSSTTECCEGLRSIDEFFIEENLSCSLMIGNYAVCSNCSNDFCEEWENFCNCPEDCEFCVDKCGDGFCDAEVCEEVGCVCVENAENCSDDCKESKFKFSVYSIGLFMIALVLIWFAVKMARIILWILAGIAVLLAFFLIFVW